MLELRDIHTYYGNIHALKGVTLRVEKGEIVCLIGANGAGKTTTLMSISGVTPPRQGTVAFLDEDVTRFTTEKIVARGITQVPEGRMIFPRLTVRENLLMGAYLRKDKDGIKAGEERAYELFPVLRERRTQMGGTLSGGEQQMLAIGRALMAQPALLLLDEPSLGLAPMVVENIFEIIQQINAEGVTVMLVEQNAQMALQISHRGYVLETGAVILEGPSADLLADPKVRLAYLGLD
ncbi:ABC transporter ATP-binding protein [Desulfovibrio sulfodismutans]|uniref:ABC transporter ATP-binding protein n=1 Tax=Desulfolutivibrio sulfodismutans TaxID=63561 RepID=A0A7K3NP71_9BACT|nr:ABC transporter ATP-binding protein [Desulfolutivibrio sulfodismutans]NDY56999.1 ABC transporter ATP-binding protein [Desulfolutivibrio sulfodismutans]QLA12057.1 ATP-binding cassette domain-containing protein [Desulfolutivibrio sulfodismutans DSM 3696]